MTDSTDGDGINATPPEDAFSLLGNETRIGIIQALGETPDEPLSFSELQCRTDVADSGQFNYHLNQLVGSFVRRTDDGEYKLTFAGSRVIGALISGRFNQRGAEISFELDSTCSVCGASLMAEYEREHVTISCPSCDDQISSFGFPPGAFENRTREELIHAFAGWIRSHLLAVHTEICLNCASELTGTVTEDSEYVEEKKIGIEHHCERCGDHTYSSVGVYLLNHPTVIAFHHEHGIDLSETPVWELPWLREEEITVLSREPWQVKFAFELDGDRLELEVDEELSATVV